MIISGEIEKVPLLDVLQVLAHSSQSGMLSVEGESTSGSIVFEAGGIICVASSSTEALLEKAMRERDAQNGRAFRRIQALAGLAELLALRAGVFRFTKVEDHVTELANVALEPFYSAGPMEAGDLLLVLATMVDRAPTSPSPAVAVGGLRAGPSSIRADRHRGGATGWNVAADGPSDQLECRGLFLSRREPSPGGLRLESLLRASRRRRSGRARRMDSTRLVRGRQGSGTHLRTDFGRPRGARYEIPLTLPGARGHISPRTIYTLTFSITMSATEAWPSTERPSNL